MRRIILFLFLLLLSGSAVQAQEDSNLPVDNILVNKADRKLYLKNGDKVIKQYRIALGGEPIGPKEREGDNKTPEGQYFIEAHNPYSSYHLSLRISYPNEEQKKKAKENNYSAGGDIMIHGLPNKLPNTLFKLVHFSMDWTQGCIAVTDEEIEEIYKLVPDKTPILITP